MATPPRWGGQHASARPRNGQWLQCWGTLFVWPSTLVNLLITCAGCNEMPPMLVMSARVQRILLVTSRTPLRSTRALNVFWALRKGAGFVPPARPVRIRSRCGVLNAFGDHRAVCATSGMLASRAPLREHAIAGVCVRVGYNVTSMRRSKMHSSFQFQGRTATDTQANLVAVAAQRTFAAEHVQPRS